MNLKRSRNPLLIALALLCGFCCLASAAPVHASDWDDSPEKASTPLPIKTAVPANRSTVNAPPEQSKNGSHAQTASAQQATPLQTPGTAAKHSSDNTTQIPKFILKGQIDHSRRLPPLGEGLQAGANFNPGNVPQAKYESNWFKIPEWFAGTFESHESTILMMHDYVSKRTTKPNKTVSSYGSELHGYQRDAKGDVWHFYVQSGNSKSTQANHQTFNAIDWYGPELIAEDKLVMRIVATSLVVDTSTGTIVDSYRREDIKTYRPTDMRALQVNFTSKSFDSHGQPRDLQTGVSIHRMAQPFRSIDRDGDKDYRGMFRDFLSRHGMPNLIPDNSR